jgi:drug/metabolite transporter (DMT)-like permease
VSGTALAHLSYFLPPVAIALGVLVRDEPITAVPVLGTALVAAGAYLVGR